MNIKSQSVLNRLRAAAYASPELLEDLEDAIDLEIAYPTIDAILEAKERGDGLETENLKELEFWRDLAGEPNPARDDFPSTSKMRITFLDMKNRSSMKSDGSGGRGRIATPRQFQNDRRRNGSSQLVQG